MVKEDKLRGSILLILSLTIMLAMPLNTIGQASSASSPIVVSEAAPAPVASRLTLFEANMNRHRLLLLMRLLLENGVILPGRMIDFGSVMKPVP